MFKHLIIWLLLGSCLNAVGQKKIYTTSKLSGSPPTIDGIINDEVWNQAEWAGDFLQSEPHDKAPASQQTKFKVIYDNDNLYLAVQCFDTAPDSIVKRMARRDFFVGDWVKIVIDSYHDLKTAFSFGVSAAGVKLDEAVTNGNDWDDSWNPIWQVKTTTNNEGWCVEASIPFTQLRFSNKSNHIWGFEVGRYLYRKSELSAWQYLPPNAGEIVHQMGELHGIQKIVPKKQKDLTPYIALGTKTYEQDYNNPFSDGRDWITQLGLDGKFGITNNLTLDFTINPDFGQIEADPSEVNLTTFETKFDERRPFFIEGKNILSLNLLWGGGPLSQDNLFYSRRIGKTPSYWPDLEDDEYIDRPSNTSILSAFKLTGKTQKGWSVGVMESITQNETAEIDYNGEQRTITIEPAANYFVGRVQKDFNQANTQIGGMVTSTHRSINKDYLDDFLHRQAYSAGLDFQHQWKDKTYYLIVTSAVSHVVGSKEGILNTQTNSPHYFQRPDQEYMKVDSTATSLTGYGGTVQIGRSGNKKWKYTVWISARSPGFNINDIGYLNHNDELQQVAWLGNSKNEPYYIFRRTNLNFNQWAGYSFGGERLYFGGNINAHATFKNYWSVGFGVDREQQSLNTETLRGGPSVTVDPLWNIYPYIQSDERKSIHLAYSYFYQRRDGKTAGAQNHDFDIRFQVSDAWTLSLSPGYHTNYEELAYVETLDELESPRYIRGTLHQETVQLVFRTDYSITPDLTIQAYAMPFISAGSYDELKYITQAKAGLFQNRYTLYEPDELAYSAADEEYEVVENSGNLAPYTFSDPNFNVFDFNLNLVIRWEYFPGSTFYLVWSQNRSESNSMGKFRIWENTETLFAKTYPTDVLLLKLSHRFGI